MKQFQQRIGSEVKRVIYDQTKKTKRSTEKRKEYVAWPCLFPLFT